MHDDAQRPFGLTDPTSFARITAWARSRSPILQKMRFRRVLIVPSLGKNFWAISTTDCFGLVRTIPPGTAFRPD